MIKLKLVIDSNVMKFICDDSKESIELRLLIYQHIQVVNENIISKYSDILNEDIVQDYIRYMCDSIEYTDDHFESLSESDEILYVAEHLKSKYRIALLKKYQRNDCERKVIIYNIDDILTGRDTLLNRYSFPYQRILKLNENIKWFGDFIRDFFENEEHIIIMDPYIMNVNGINALEKIYLPAFSKTSKIIDIYFCSKRCFNQKNELDSLITSLRKNKKFNNNNVSIRIYDVCNKKKLHDRRILAGSYQMLIPAGLDVIVNDIVDTETSINTSDNGLVDIPKNKSECNCIFISKNKI